MKHRIMEAILSGDNNLTKEEIDWAISNIPNGVTPLNSDYNHELSDMGDACGITDEVHKAVKKEYIAIRDLAGEKGSHIIEALEKSGSKLLLRSLMIRGMMEIEQDSTKKMLDQLTKLLDKLK